METDSPPKICPVASVRWACVIVFSSLMVLAPCAVIQQEVEQSHGKPHLQRIQAEMSTRDFELGSASTPSVSTKEEHDLDSVQAGISTPDSEKPSLPTPSVSAQEEHDFYPIIFAAAGKYRVDPALVKAIIQAESDYDPRAVSSKGASGLMQLMPETAKELGVQDLFNPEHNIHGGVRYLKHLLNQLEGDVQLALAAYNAGIGNVRRYQGIPPYKATHHYVKRVLQYYQNYKRKAEQGNEV